MHDKHLLYTGFIQALLLAGAIKCPIQLNNWDAGHELYDLFVPPCCCLPGSEYEALLNVMWVQVGDVPLSTTNHIIPLLPLHKKGIPAYRYTSCNTVYTL